MSKNIIPARAPNKRTLVKLGAIVAAAMLSVGAFSLVDTASADGAGYAEAIMNSAIWQVDPTSRDADEGFTKYYMPGTMKDSVDAPDGFMLGDPDYLTLRVIDAKDPVPIQRYEWNGGRTETPPAPPTEGDLGQWNPSTTNWNPNRGEVMGEVAQRAQGNNASWYYWSATPAVQAVDVTFVRWELVEIQQEDQDVWCEDKCLWCEVCEANPLPQYGYVRQNWRANEGRPDGGEAPGFYHAGWHNLQERTFTEEQPTTEVGVPLQQGGGDPENASWFRWVRVDTGGSRDTNDWKILTTAS